MTRMTSRPGGCWPRPRRGSRRWPGRPRSSANQLVRLAPEDDRGHAWRGRRSSRRTVPSRPCPRSPRPAAQPPQLRAPAQPGARAAPEQAEEAGTRRCRPRLVAPSDGRRHARPARGHPLVDGAATGRHGRRPAALSSSTRGSPSPTTTRGSTCSAVAGSVWPRQRSIVRLPPTRRTRWCGTTWMPCCSRLPGEPSSLGLAVTLALFRSRQSCSGRRGRARSSVSAS